MLNKTNNVPVQFGSASCLCLRNARMSHHNPPSSNVLSWKVEFLPVCFSAAAQCREDRSTSGPNLKKFPGPLQTPRPRGMSPRRPLPPRFCGQNLSPPLGGRLGSRNLRMLAGKPRPLLGHSRRLPFGQPGVLQPLTWATSRHDDTQDAAKRSAALLQRP